MEYPSTNDNNSFVNAGIYLDIPFSFNYYYLSG